MSRRKLHIGLALSSLRGGGAERVTLTLANALIERGHRVDLFLAQCNGAHRDGVPESLRLFYPGRWKADRSLLRRCRERGITAKALGVNPAAAARAWLALRRRHPGIRIRPGSAYYALGVAAYLREARPDALLSALPMANAAALLGAELANARTPLIIGLHYLLGRVYTEEQLARARALYPQASAFAAVSQAVADEASERLGIDPARFHVIRNGLPIEKIRRLSEAEPSCEWFTDGGPPVILTVGSDEPLKDRPTLVKAFGLVRREREARLVIMGGGSQDYRRGLFSIAARFGAEKDLAFLDFDENPYPAMRRAAALALSSWHEAFPTVLIEAMACGTPVVSTDCPFGPREILGGGEWGTLAPVSDPPGLARAIAAALDGDAPSVDEAARRAEDFDERRMAADYEELFARLAEEGSEGALAQ